MSRKLECDLLFGRRSGRRGSAKHIAVGIVIAVVTQEHQLPGRSLFGKRSVPRLPWLSARVGGVEHVDEASIH